MQLLGYIFFRILIFIFWLLPFRIIYWLSDGLCFLFLNVVKYRYQVIRTNLENSFPLKNKTEIDALVKDAYRNLCDILLEGIKGMSLSDKEALKRYKFFNTELTDELYNKGEHVVMVASHYANWEWAPQAINLQLKHLVVGLVARIKNKYIDRYFLKHRTGENVKVIYPDLAAKAIANWKERPSMFVYIADQSPPSPDKADWIQFLNQDTACLWGADRMARNKNWKVVHLDVQRVKRGFYEARLEMVNNNPTETQEGEITQQYFSLLEKNILKKPGDWLWSHRRWKHKR